MSATAERKAGLDSLRFFAILAVLFDHYVRPEIIHLGSISVRFFLLLSGFLITRTLLKYASSNWSENRFVLKSFYGRRSLRIWPLYYAILLWLFVAGWISGPQLLVHGAFLTNFAQAWLNNWDIPWYLSHVWTLCVQEQFYLMWPILFMVLGTNHWMFLGSMIAAAIIFRSGMWIEGLAYHTAFYTLPLASFDALAIGSLLAIFHKAVNRWIKHLVTTIVALLAICFYVAELGNGFLQLVVAPTLWLIPLSLLTIGIFEERLGPFGNFLNWPPLIFFGRISLGIYLLHLPVWEAYFRWSPPWLSPHIEAGSLQAFALLTATTHLVAAGTWFSFEKPLQHFRKHLPYRPVHQKAAPV